MAMARFINHILRYPFVQPAPLPVLHGPLHVLIDSTGLQVYRVGQWLEVPPRSTAIPSGGQRDRHLKMITERGRLAWQVATD